MPPPHNMKQIQSFLGITGYYRQCIRGYANISQPLTELTKKRQKFVWNSQCQSALDSLKKDQENLVS